MDKSTLFLLISNGIVQITKLHRSDSEITSNDSEMTSDDSEMTSDHSEMTSDISEMTLRRL